MNKKEYLTLAFYVLLMAAQLYVLSASIYHCAVEQMDKAIYELLIFIAIVVWRIYTRKEIER
jgi:hypothetical protein